MMLIRRGHERGHADHGWLDSFHTFSFADYHDPRWMGFRSLRVINDDRVAPGMGFGMHPHRDMEILTYVLTGSLEHRDSMGNGRVIRAGDMQYMAAGTGVHHSEKNPSSEDWVHLLQIWIVPERRGVTPRYEEKSMAGAASGVLHLVASREGRNGSMVIHQDAEVWLGKLQAGDCLQHPLASHRQVWVHVAEGQLELNGEALSAGDGAAVSEADGLALTATAPAQVLIFDLA